MALFLCDSDLDTSAFPYFMLILTFLRFLPYFCLVRGRKMIKDDALVSLINISFPAQVKRKNKRK